MKTSLLTLSISIAMLSFSCKKDSDTLQPEPTPTPIDTSISKLSIQFSNMVDNLELQFGTKYTNFNGDTFSVSKLNYYISNIVLTKSDNSTYQEKNSYHLIQASNPSSSVITFTNVPSGAYKSVKFMLGVDSARNVSGVQSGDLDPAKGMFWNWTTGYIMFKLEGNAPSSTQQGDYFEYHLGGYKGVNKVIRDFNLDFSGAFANVSLTTFPKLVLAVNVNELFESPTVISLANLSVVNATGNNAKMLADNYANMIRFKQINN